MKNTLTDVANIVVEAMEKLSEADLKNEDLTGEINRSKAIAEMAMTFVAINKLALEAVIAADSFIKRDVELPKMLRG